MSTTTYTALAERSGDWWAIEVPEVRGVRTQAKRLDRAEYMARDAIALMLDVPADSFDVEVHPHLSAEAEDAVRCLSKARDELEEARRNFVHAGREAARALVQGMGLTVRDAGRILHVSHQRVDQLLHPR